MSNQESLESTFKKYSKDQVHLDGRAFNKIFKDSKLYDKHFTSTGADIIFNKIKTKGTLKITFEQFLQGIALAAEEKKVSAEVFAEKLSLLHGPEYHGTKAQHTKLHDDKTLYTGVYKQGGPTTVDKGKIVDLSYLANREEANVRGVNVDIIELTKEEQEQYAEILKD